MSGRRFIAGAVCPACGMMDRLVLESDGGLPARYCVACDYRDVLDPPTSQAPRTRLEGVLKKRRPDGTEKAQPVRIVEPAKAPPTEGSRD